MQPAPGRVREHGVWDVNRERVDALVGRPGARRTGYDQEREESTLHTLRIIADRGDRGNRLDLVLRRHLAGVQDFTRTRVQKWFALGLVTVNGRQVFRVSSRAVPGDVVSLTIPDAAIRVPRTAAAEDVPVRVLYEDDDLLIVDKPAGVVSHPTFKNATGTLLNALLGRARDWPPRQRPSLVSRLDKLTSGAVIVAKRADVHAALQRTLVSPRSEKEYLAVVYGKVKTARGRVALPIGPDPRDRRRMRASVAAGAPSVTDFERLARIAAPPVGLAVLRCRLVTGRRHQIRAHLAARGWPLVGDPLYGEPRWADFADSRTAAALRDFPRQALHAWRLTFTQPRTGARVRVEAPVPEDLAALLGYFDVIV